MDVFKQKLVLEKQVRCDLILKQATGSKFSQLSGIIGNVPSNHHVEEKRESKLGGGVQDEKEDMT